MKKIELKLLVLLVFIASIGLIGWFTNNVFLTSISTSFYPIAPLAAILLILSGISYSSFFIANLSKSFDQICFLLTVLSILLATFSLINYFFIPNWSFEELVFNNPFVFNNSDLGKISPLAAVLFIFSNLIYLFVKYTKSKLLFFISKLFFYTTFSTSILFLLGYIENKDFIFFNDILSLAALTAFCFFILSFIQLYALNYNVWPFSNIYDNSIQSKLKRFFIPTIIGLFLLDHWIEGHLFNKSNGYFTSSLILLIILFTVILVINLIATNVSHEINLSNKKLAENEERFKLAAKATNEVIWERDLFKETFWRSENFALIFGWNNNDFGYTDIDMHKRLHPDDLERVAAKIYQFFTSDEDYWKDEYRMLKKDGTYAWVSDSAYKLKNKKGTPIKVVGSMVDVTEKKKAELELISAKEKAEESEDILNYFFMQSLDGFFFMMLDKPIDWNDSINKEETLNYVFQHQKVTKTNDALLDQYRATRKQLIGFTPANFFEHDINYGKKIWGELFDKKQLRIDTNEKKFDGTDMIVEGDYTCIYNTENQIIGVFGIQREVTAIRKAQNELLKLSRAIEQSPVSIFITDINGTIEYINPKVTQITGYEASELIGQNPRVFSSGEKGKNEYTELWNTISSGKEWFGEFHNKKKNGELFWEYASISPIKDTEGKITHYLAVKEDITKQKGLVTDLRAIKNKALQGQKSYKALFETIGDAIYIQDYEANFINVNKGVLTMYGYSKEEFIGNNPVFLSAPDKNDMPAVFESFDKVKQGIPQVFEFWGKRKNGEIFPKIVSQYKGTYFGQDVVITVARDISNQFKTQQELILAKEKAEEHKLLFEGLFNNATIGLYQTTPEGQIISVNPTLIKLLKFDSLEDILSRDLTNGSYLDQNKRNQFKAILAEKGEIIGFESEWKTKDGEIVVVLESARVAKDENGRIIRYDGVVENISEKVQLINDLRIAKEKAEESDRLKSAFLANMSHEIRTPMNSILGFSDLLLNEELSSKKKERYHEIVHDSGKRLMNLISDIVDISKIDANQFTLNYSIFNLNTLIDNLKSQFKISPLLKNVSIYTSKAVSDEKSFIKSDNTRLSQVLSNLIENALKFTQNGTVEIGYTTNDTEIQFFVKDTGVGIDKKDQELIFERFGQSDNQHQNAKEGTGLGLSISKGIIEVMGGKIWVVSEPFKGATFHFTIPNCFTHTVIQEKTEPVIIDVATIKTPTILIAEDEESNFWFLEAVLEKQNFKILHAENGKEAVNMFQNNDVDLILMDFNMPVMNGIEATIEIRKLNQKISIIALTAYAMAEDKEKAEEVGCNDFLSKPIKKELLLDTINYHLKQTKII